METEQVKQVSCEIKPREFKRLYAILDNVYSSAMGEEDNPYSSQIKDMMGQISAGSPPESEYAVSSAVWKKLADETGIESDLRETPGYVGRWIAEKNSALVDSEKSSVLAFVAFNEIAHECGFEEVEFGEVGVVESVLNDIKKLESDTFSLKLSFGSKSDAIGRRYA